MILYLVDGGSIVDPGTFEQLLAQRYGKKNVGVRHAAEGSLEPWQFTASIDVEDGDKLHITCLPGGSLSIDGLNRDACGFVLWVYGSFLAGRRDVELCDKDAECRVSITPAMDLDELARLFEDYE